MPASCCFQYASSLSSASPVSQRRCQRAKSAYWTGSSGNGEGRRRPRINEVLKPGEEVLVQIVKEQFANKPPTLSTFYSLAGRYLVLLPGSDDAGISRRIEGAERTRIRELIEKLEAPDGFGPGSGGVPSTDGSVP